jgi:hypothetical protein
VGGFNLKFLKAVFNRAVKHGRITYNPARAVKLYREDNARNRCLTAEEEIRLMVLRDGRSPYRDAPGRVARTPVGRRGPFDGHHSR